MDLAGHASLAMVQRYSTVFSGEHLEAAEKLAPRRRSLNATRRCEQEMRARVPLLTGSESRGSVTVPALSLPNVRRP